MAPMITLYGIPNCDTVKRARAWLADQGLDYQFHDFKKAGVPSEALTTWLDSFGPDRVLNRAGTTWRRLAEADQALALTPDGLHRLLTAQPSLIKRPVVHWADGRLSLGFSADLFEAHR